MSQSNAPAPADTLDVVQSRYAEGARTQVPELCCPVDFDARLLAVLPDEIIERDYGCGDPSRFVRPGETVLDLGSGGGKICYMASQIVGAGGRVIGVDATPDMLALARRWQHDVGARILRLRKREGSGDDAPQVHGPVTRIAARLRTNELDDPRLPVPTQAFGRHRRVFAFSATDTASRAQTESSSASSSTSAGTCQ